MLRMNARSRPFLALVLLLSISAPAQEAAQDQTTQKPARIQDNSFLLEEAYNQEFGVVQHIQSFARDWQTHEWTYTFTQEWPVDLAPRHQLSYTVPLVHGSAGSGTGVGDVAINYRYQLVGNSD